MTAARLTRRSLIVLVALTLLGCTKMTRLDPESGRLAHRIAPGDVVQVTTKDGREMEFEVVSVDDQLISGSDQSVRIQDIEVLRREDQQYEDPIGTLVVVLAMVGSFILLLAI